MNKIHISWLLTAVLAVCILPLLFIISPAFLGWRTTIYIAAPIILVVFIACTMLVSSGRMPGKSDRNPRG